MKFNFNYKKIHLNHIQKLHTNKVFDKIFAVMIFFYLLSLFILLIYTFKK